MKLFLRILLIFFLIFLSFVGFLFLFLYLNLPTEYKKPKDYPKIYNLITHKEMISHFPKSIPESASQIKVWGYSDMPYNGEVLMLEFKIDKSYIDKEFKSNTFINSQDKLGTKQKIYHMPDKCSDPANYTYYVIKNKDNLAYYKEYFPYYNGIGIDIKNNKILYYYIFPAD